MKILMDKNQRYTENEFWARMHLRGIPEESVFEGLDGFEGRAKGTEFDRRRDAIMADPLTPEECAKALALDAEDLTEALEEAKNRYGPGCLPFLQYDYNEGRNYTDNQLRDKLLAFYRKHRDPIYTMTDKEQIHKEFDKRRIMNEEFFETEAAFRSWAREEYGKPQVWGLHAIDSPDYWRLIQIDILEAAPYGLKWDNV